MSSNAPLTEEQRNAIAELRVMYASTLESLPLGVAESVDERGRRPTPESFPADLAVHIEIAPPSSKPHPLLNDTGVLKTPERVPVYFYFLPNDHVESGFDADIVDTRVVFFIHGGGNITGHPTHLPFVQLYAQLLRAVATYSKDAAITTKWVLIAPSYRLATVPENAFPAALQDLVAAYDHVLGKGYRPSNVYIAGDSAGGNHALVLTHLVLQSEGPAPRGVIAIAPSAMRVFSDEHTRARTVQDILESSIYEKMTRTYLGDSGVPLTDPLVSSAFLPFASTWPRTLVFVGTSDRLLDGAREVEKRLKEIGRPVGLIEYKERPHGWWVMPHIFPENVQDAVERIARFVSH